jgi:hypothetical protein
MLKPGKIIHRHGIEILLILLIAVLIFLLLSIIF